MREIESTIPRVAGVLLIALSAACEDGSGHGGGGSAAHVFRGTYEVPVTDELASAAVYDVPEVEWKISNGAAKLEYDLPLGLVGKAIRVEFTGSYDASAATVTLAGAPGTAACDVASAGVDCNETMSGLLPIEPDYAVIEQIAQAEYPGPAQHRIDVAKQFSVDPIGIVHVDLGAPAEDDESEED